MKKSIKSISFAAFAITAMTLAINPVHAQTIQTIDDTEDYRQEYGLDHFNIWLNRPSTVYFSPKSSSDDDYHTMQGQVSWISGLEIFGKEAEIVNFRARQNGKANKQAGNGLCRIKIMGYDKPCADWEDYDSHTYTSPAISFFSEKKLFVVAGIPVTVRAEAAGDWGVHAEGTYGRDTLGVKLEPNAGIDAVVSASAGVDGIASVGVRGDFQIVDLTVGNKLDMEYYPHDSDTRTKLLWDRERYHNFTVLAGTLTPYYTALNNTKHYGNPIVDFNGYTKNHRDIEHQGHVLD